MKILILLLFASTVAGQTFQRDPLRDLMGDLESARPSKLLCTVPLSKSPAVRGKYRLGISRAEYDRRSGPVLLGVGPIGVADLQVSPTFFEDKLVKLSVTYLDDVAWDSAAEFAYVVATEFGLPPAAWREVHRDRLVMFCEGWLIIAGRFNDIELRDEIAIRRMIKSTADSEKAAAEEKKKAFKP